MGGENRGMKSMAALAICAALAVSGCASVAGSRETLQDQAQREAVKEGGKETGNEDESRPAEPKDPVYVYYIKDSNLMRADINENMDPGSNPSVIMEGVGENCGLQSYYNMQQAEDGSFLVFNLESDTDMFGYQEKLIAVSQEDGRARLIHEGNLYARMFGSRLLFQIEEEAGAQNTGDEQETGDYLEEVQYNLYSYTPSEGIQLIAPDTYDFYPSEDGSSVCFTRMDQDYNGTVYVYRDGVESWLADDMEFAGADVGLDNIYLEQYVYNEGQEYYELVRIGRDGSKEEILTEDDGLASYYLTPDTGSIYYLTEEEEEKYSMYFWSGGEKQLLSHDVVSVWDFIQEPDWLDGKSMMIYMCEENGETALYAAIEGKVSELATPGISADWMNGWTGYITGNHDAVYLTVKRMESQDSYRTLESWIYKYELNGSQLSQPSAYAARGKNIGFIKDEGKGIFYTDHSNTLDLYYRDAPVLRDYTGGSILKNGEEDGGYLAFREKGTLPPALLPYKWAWLSALVSFGEEPARDLMRISTDGSSEVYKRDVVMCEAYDQGLVMLSDCGASSPYHGTLSFYDGPDRKIIDKDVAVFFQYDDERFMDAFPWNWGL